MAGQNGHLMRRPAAAILVAVAVGATSACGGGGEPAAEAVGLGATTTPKPAPDAPTASAATTLPATSTSVAPPGSVVVIGDSLTESAKEELDATLHGRGIATVTIDGVANRRMVRFADGVPPGVEAIADVVAAGAPAPEVWVLALGTNDVGGAASPEEFEADMRAVLALVPADAPVVWVDVWIRDLAQESAAANAVVREVLATREAATVIDWYSRGDDPGVILDDGVHLTDDGQWIFATAITDAVAAAGG
jgi:lysophospholipase L1-like esterase